MQMAGRLIQPFGPALVRTTAGRAVIYAEIVSRPSQVRSEQALGDMNAFLEARYTTNAILAAATPFTAAVPAGIPVTIAWGTNDRLLPPRQALVAKERIPAARLVPLPGCGHVPMTDNPKLVADVLLRGSRVPQHVGRQSAAGLSQAEPGPGGELRESRQRILSANRANWTDRAAIKKFRADREWQTCSIVKAMPSGLVWITEVCTPSQCPAPVRVAALATGRARSTKVCAAPKAATRYGDAPCDF
jgi:hypothetical protein